MGLSRPNPISATDDDAIASGGEIDYANDTPAESDELQGKPAPAHRSLKLARYRATCHLGILPEPLPGTTPPRLRTEAAQLQRGPRVQTSVRVLDPLCGMCAVARVARLPHGGAATAFPKVGATSLIVWAEETDAVHRRPIRLASRTVLTQNGHPMGGHFTCF
jgi:hypothetical protein